MNYFFVKFLSSKQGKPTHDRRPDDREGCTYYRCEQAQTDERGQGSFAGAQQTGEKRCVAKQYPL